jgi:hypothetical protein
LVIPRGERGVGGREGVKGKDGSHEFINIVYAGNCPRFTNDMLTSYCIVDGVIDLPVMQESEIGMWTHIKTFTDVNVTGLVEDSLKLHKGEGRKFVVVNYGGKYQFTAF